VVLGAFLEYFGTTLNQKSKMINNQLKAGAAFTNITPKTPHFLHGYPYVKRISEGVHDWLLSSALFITDGTEQAIFISNDILYVGKASVSRIRKEISEKTGVPVSNIMIAATHTHSGPVTVNCAISLNDPVVPEADTEYLQYLEQQIIHAACEAFRNAVPAQAGFALTDGTGIGTNRRNPSWASDTGIPLMIVRDIRGGYIACMMVCNMHPTVLHEDSKFYSGDFPACARYILQKKYLGCECPVLHFTGAAGNQSPRHVAKSNTFEEAERIGGILAGAVARAIKFGVDYCSGMKITCRNGLTDLPRRKFPVVEWAEENRNKAVERLNMLREKSDNRQDIRTAEVDLFGAEEQLFLSRQAGNNKLEDYYNTCLPAEIQVIRVGSHTFVAWPGEIFVEYAIALKDKYRDTFLITLANGELQGYIATAEAEKENYYEASNSLFHYSGGDVLLLETCKLLNSI
jgi:hypothetical protein